LAALAAVIGWAYTSPNPKNTVSIKIKGPRGDFCPLINHHVTAYLHFTAFNQLRAYIGALRAKFW